MESIALQLPLYTALSAACLMLIQVALMFSVIKSRGDLNIFISHGDNRCSSVKSEPTAISLKTCQHFELAFYCLNS